MPSIEVTARLWVKDARFAEFIQFETRAFQIMERHGVVVLEIRKDHAQDLSGGPHETHVLRFPHRSAFEAYRADPELSAMADLRAKCIARSEVEIVEQ